MEKKSFVMAPRKIAIRKRSGSVFSEHPVDQPHFEVCVFLGKFVFWEG
jgi:hypothetical protein